MFINYYSSAIPVESPDFGIVEKSACVFNTEIKTQNVFVDDLEYLNVLKQKIVTNSPDNDTNPEEMFEQLMAESKISILHLIAEKASEKDFSFFKKFFVCYLGSDVLFDDMIVGTMLDISFNSDDYVLQDYGINLLSIYRNQESLKDFFSYNFSKKYLKNKIKLISNEDVY